MALPVGQLVAEPANSGSGIHYDNVTAFGSDFNTGRITAVLQYSLPDTGMDPLEPQIFTIIVFL